MTIRSSTKPSIRFNRNTRWVGATCQKGRVRIPSSKRTRASAGCLFVKSLFAHSVSDSGEAHVFEWQLSQYNTIGGLGCELFFVYSQRTMYAAGHLAGVYRKRVVMHRCLEQGVSFDSLVLVWCTIATNDFVGA